MVHGPEEEPPVLAEVAGSDAALPVGNLALAHTPEELETSHERFTDPAGRFTIDTLRDRSNQAVPAETVLPRRDSFRARFVRAFYQGILSIHLVPDAWRSVAGGDFGFSVEYPIRADAIPANRLDADGRVAWTDLTKEDRDTLHKLVDPQAGLQAVEQAYGQWEKVLSKFYVDALEDSDDHEGLRRLTLQEAFVFAANPTEGKPGYDDHEALILNFGPQLTQEQLCAFARAQHDVANMTSGYLNERFRTFVVLPEDHPSLMVTLEDENGTPKTLARDAYTEGHTIFMSAKRFHAVKESPKTPNEQPPEAPKGESSMSEAQKFLAQYLRPGEQTEGAEAIRWTMSQGGDLWATLVHEMFHLVLGNMLYQISDETRISLYAFVDGEAGSEMAVAVLMRALGEDYMQNRITEKDLIEFGKILTNLEKGRIRDKEPDGQFIVAGRQVDLRGNGEALPPRPRTSKPLDTTGKFIRV